MKNGILSEELVISHIADALATQPNWNELIGNAAKKCIKKGVEGTEKLKNLFSNPPFNIKIEECNPIPMYIANCVDSELLVVSFRFFYLNITKLLTKHPFRDP